MEFLEIIKYGAYLFTGIIGWFVKVLWDAVGSLREDIHDLEVKLSEDYVTKDQLSNTLERLFNKLDRIEDYLLNHRDQ